MQKQLDISTACARDELILRFSVRPDGQLSVCPTDAETLGPLDNEALRQSYFGRRSSKNSQHGLSASATKVEQACVVEEQPTRTSTSRRRIKAVAETGRGKRRASFKLLVAK